MMKKTFGVVGLICLFSVFSFIPMACAEDISEINSRIKSEGTGTATIRGEKIPETTLTYEIKGDLAIFEGDIVLGKISEFANSRSDGAIITGSFYRWPNNTVPYRLASNVTAATASNVTSAIAYIESKTSLKFVKRTSANAGQYPDYITVQSDQIACWSYVGRTSGEQQLNVVEACGFGATVHEFCHALGMWHEQSREDRNSYVTINYANIETGKEHNFDQHISDGDDILAYDYGSLMHYGAKDFSKNGLPTIETIPPGIAIGQRNGLSTTDINTIAAMYGGVAPPPPPPPTSAVSALPAMYKLLFGSCPVIPNGDFESGGTSWWEYSLQGETIIKDWITPSHGGAQHAWLGWAYDEIAWITQYVTVSASCPYLSFYYQADSEEGFCTWDYGYVRINGSDVKTFPLCNGTDTSGWTKTTVNLSSYANQSVSLMFRITTDSSNRSNWHIDDVSFQASP